MTAKEFGALLVLAGLGAMALVLVLTAGWMVVV